MGNVENKAPEQPKRAGFQKGKSGNPGGRPKVQKDVIELARSMGKDALRALLDVASHSADDKARVMAAEAILNRGFGKPAQSVDLTSRGETLKPEAGPPPQVFVVAGREIKF